MLVGLGHNREIIEIIATDIKRKVSQKAPTLLLRLQHITNQGLPY